MTMPYARRTKIPVNRTRQEIEQLVKRFGAKGFASGWTDTTARVEFFCQNRHIRLTVAVPPSMQAEREQWRALSLLVKAKLVAVDAKIATFEEAFFADIVMPETGKTVWETAREPVKLAYEGGKGVKLLG
jgi:hypothetical protein